MFKIGEEIIFAITSDDFGLMHGTGFFVSDTKAVTAKHVLELILQSRQNKLNSPFISCKIVRDNAAPILFHLAVAHMSDANNLDFGVLRVPTETEARDHFLFACPSHSYLPIGLPKWLPSSFTISMHPSIDSATSGIYVDQANISRIADGGMYCTTSSLYPGDSGCPLIQNMHIIGIFLGPRNATHQLRLRTPQTEYVTEEFQSTFEIDHDHSAGSQSDSEVTGVIWEKKKKKRVSKTLVRQVLPEITTQFNTVKADLDMLSDTTSELARNHGQHTFFLSFEKIGHLLR